MLLHMRNTRYLTYNVHVVMCVAVVKQGRYKVQSFATRVSFFLTLTDKKKSGMSLIAQYSVRITHRIHVASSPGSFPLSARGRKEPGNIGGFKPLTSGGSDRAPPIRLRNEIMWMCDSLKAWRTEISQSKTNKEF